MLCYHSYHNILNHFIYLRFNSRLYGGKKAKFYHISKFGTKLMSWEKPKILTIDNNNNNKQKEKQIGERLEFSSIKF